MYFDLNKIISYNAFLNIIIGERGTGKTYSCSKFVTNDFIKHDNQFVYIRRYKTELKKAIPSFFSPLITNNEFQNHNLKNSGYEKLIIDDNIAGFGIALTQAQTLKSVNFNKVKNIIFDEFIAENGIYLKNEVHSFLSLIETIARMRNVRIFMLANSATISNPYFLEFNLNLPYNNEIKLFKDGLILLNYTKNLEYRQAKKQTKFGKLIEGTDFADFAIDNKFILDNNTFLGKKTGSSKFIFAFSYQNDVFGVWCDYTIGKMFVSNDYIENTHIFTTTIENHNANTLLIENARNYNVWRKFLNSFKSGSLYFENQKIKNATMNVIKMFIKR